MHAKEPKQAARLDVLAGATAVETTAGDARLFISPRDLATRWQCSRTQVDRIARRAGLTRYCLGHGRNGMVRYLRKEVEAFEGERRV